MTKSKLVGGRVGLTLMELVVVLAIIVAVTGIVVAIIPNMIHRANIASCTATITELDKIVQSYQGLYSEIPNKMDNLVVGTSMASYVMDGAKGEYGVPSFVSDALTAGEAAALSEAGLTSLATIVENPGGDTDWRPSFWPYGASQLTPPTLTPVAAGVNVAFLTQTGAKLMGLPHGVNGVPAGGESTGNYRYVIFGYNKPCTLFRNMATEPPYHFADTKAEDPATYYMAFAGVFMVARDFDGTAKTMGKARYMGTIAFHDFGLSTSAMHTREWWDRLKDERPLQ